MAVVADDLTVVDTVEERVRVCRLVGVVTEVDVAWAAAEESERIEVKSATWEESLDLGIVVATTISELAPEITLVTTADVATRSELA